MVEPPIPRWLSALDDRKPYPEVLEGERLPAVSPFPIHGRLAVRIGAQVDSWAGPRASVGTEIRHYFLEPDGRWTSLLPDVSYTSVERLPDSPNYGYEQPRVAPDLVFEILSPRDRRSQTARKVEKYLAHGARLVIVLDPKRRRLTLHDGSTVATLEARGTWPVPGFEGLAIDWEAAYRGIDTGDPRPPESG